MCDPDTSASHLLTGAAEGEAEALLEVFGDGPITMSLAQTQAELSAGRQLRASLCDRLSLSADATPAQILERLDATAEEPTVECPVVAVEEVQVLHNLLRPAWHDHALRVALNPVRERPEMQVRFREGEQWYWICEGYLTYIAAELARLSAKVQETPASSTHNAAGWARAAGQAQGRAALGEGPADLCPAHGLPEPCPTCSAYIAAGL